MDKITYIIDGGFFTKSFHIKYKNWPTASIVEKYIQCVHKYLGKHHVSSHLEIYRIFFYDCEPIKTILANPIDNSKLNLSRTQAFKYNYQLQHELKQKDYFALRFGQLKIAQNHQPWHQWKVSHFKIHKLLERPISAKDLWLLSLKKELT